MNNEFVIQPIKIPHFMCIDNKPPTLYSLLDSIVNYGKTQKTKIKDLAKAGRTKIFDFNYPLSNNVNKEEFETNILNHYLTRRIGQETFTSFQIMLNVKLNEIMPKYNSMFDVLVDWNIIEEVERGNRNINKEDNSKSTNNIETSSNTSTETTQDKRFSDLPQNQIQNVKDGSYLTEYGFDTNNSNSEDKSTSEGKSNTTATQNTEDVNILKKLNPDRYFEYIEKMQNVYTLIYKDLDCLFYQLV